MRVNLGWECGNKIVEFSLVVTHTEFLLPTMPKSGIKRLLRLQAIEKYTNIFLVHILSSSLYFSSLSLSLFFLSSAKFLVSRSPRVRVKCGEFGEGC